MALSSIHDVGTHGNAVNQSNPHTYVQHGMIDSEKHFRPNPDAKPFFPPTRVAIAHAGNCQFIDKNINGVVPPYWINQSTDHPENLVVAPQPSGGNLLKKQHIAFHLVSNLLDEELPEEKDRDINVGFPNSPRLNMYEQGVEHVHGWQTNVEPLNLPLEMVKANVENSSINNKSISEIWSPDPSPNGLSSVSPTEEINPYVPNQQQQKQQHQQQQQQQQQQIEGNPDNSFEQPLANDSENTEQHGSTGLLAQQPQLQQQQHHQQHHHQQQQPYSTAGYEEVDANQNQPTSPTQMYYPPPQMIHQQYVYRGMGPPPPSQHRGAPPPEMYPVHQAGPRANLMQSRPSVIYGPGYYEAPPHFNKYPQPHQQQHPNTRYRPRYNHHDNYNNNNNNNQQQQQHQQQHHHNRHYPNYHVSYETKMGFLEELGISLDECRDQLRHLEKDYKKADLTLSRDFRLRKSSMGDSQMIKYPPNSTRVDKLIADQQKEHQKVESLIGRIERLGFTPMHPNVGVTLDSWLASIKELRSTRKNEIATMVDTPSSQYGSKSHAQSDVNNLIKAVKAVAKNTRAARTVVWCAVQMLYANCVSNENSPSGD